MSPIFLDFRHCEYWCFVDTWIIVGAVLGTVVVLAVIAIVGCCILKKKKFKRFKDPRGECFTMYILTSFA